MVNQLEQSLNHGDYVERTDTGRRAIIVNGESLFVALVQYINDGQCDWVSKDLLERVEHEGRT